MTARVPTNSRTSNHSFYDQYPDVYHAFARRRDIKREIDRYRFGSVRAGKTLELFAGPAYHTREMARRNWPSEFWAIDASPGMKDLAVKLGFPHPDRYLVGDAVECMATMFDLSCVLIPGMSLGLIAPEQASELIRSVAKSLVPGGIAYIELYRIDSLMSRLRRTRPVPKHVVHDRREFVYCSPSAQPRWDPDAWHVWIPASITIRDGTHVREIRFESEEWLYTENDLRNWVACDPFDSTKIDSVEANQVSTIYRLTKTISEQ